MTPEELEALCSRLGNLHDPDIRAIAAVEAPPIIRTQAARIAELERERDAAEAAYVGMAKSQATIGREAARQCQSARQQQDRADRATELLRGAYERMSLWRDTAFRARIDAFLKEQE